MGPRQKDAFQLRVGLLGILPIIWRRILVPVDYTFWDLHVAIQDAMGWADSHLHLFRVTNPATRYLEHIGIPDEMNDFLPGWETPIDPYLTHTNPLLLYEYDFGDSWLHEVVMEDMVQTRKKLPSCLDGERACPPEDVGGPPGFVEFLAAIQDPGHPEHDSMLDRVGGEFDPERFDCREVVFDSPAERRRRAFGRRFQVIDGGGDT